MGVNFRHLVSVGGLTLASRIMGVVRDVLIAFVFGTSAASDAFFIAFRPFDLLRKLFSEGVFGLSLVPIFSQYLEKGKKDQAIGLFLSGLFLLSAAGAVAVVFGIIFAPVLVGLLAPGFAGDSYTQTLTVLLLRMMMPYLLIVLILALCMALLNSLGEFAIPAATPVILNLAIVFSALVISRIFEPAIIALALGVIIGGIVQLGFQVPYILRNNMVDLSFFTWCHQGLLRAGKVLIPCMVGAASYQINVVAAGVFASHLDRGSVSFLYFADRLVQLPMALFAASFSTVFLPYLSRKTAAGSPDEANGVFGQGVKLVFFITLPAMAGLMALDKPIVRFLFGQGAFDTLSVQYTAGCLWYLAIGLWAFVGGRVFSTYHFALGNYRIPFAAGITSIALNLFLGFPLMASLGVKGLCLSISLSAMAGFMVMLFAAPGIWFGTGLALSSCRALFLSVIMFFLVRAASGVFEIDSLGKPGLGTGILACVLLGAGFYFLMGSLISCPEIKILKKAVMKK